MNIIKEEMRHKTLSQFNFKHEVKMAVYAITSTISSMLPIPKGLKMYSIAMQNLGAYQINTILHKAVDGINNIWHYNKDRNYIVNYNEDKSRYNEEMLYHQCFSIELPQRDRELLVIDTYVRKEDSYLFFDWRLATNVSEHKMEDFEPVEDLI